MKSLKEMTTAELRSLKTNVEDAIRIGGASKDLVTFRNAIDDELANRGA